MTANVLYSPMVSFILAFALACVSGPENDTASIPDAYIPPDRPGILSVATSRVELVSRNGLDLQVRGWFPTAEADGDLVTYGGYGTGEALDGAAPDCAETRRVVLLSHASGGEADQLWPLAEYLATHGALVLAPTHLYNTRDDFDADALAANILRRPFDLMDVYDDLLANSDSGALAGCVDADAGYAIIGHDLGAISALMTGGMLLDIPALDQLCADGETLYCQIAEEFRVMDERSPKIDRTDARVTAVGAIAPSDLGVEVGDAAYFAPAAVVLGGTADTTAPWDAAVRATYDLLPSSPRGAGAIDGAGHWSFTALCEDTPMWCEADTLDASEVQRISNATLQAFLELSEGEERASAYLPPPDDVDTIWWDED